MSIDVRSDCRLHDYIKECWRNDYCWRAHDPCPDGLPKYPSWQQRHPVLSAVLGNVAALLWAWGCLEAAARAARALGIW